jgi:dTDP-4-dehydrorhamnose 3,5-epimerase
LEKIETFSSARTTIYTHFLMNFINTSIPDVILIEPKVLYDERGFFLETYQAKVYAAAGISANFVQDNHSRSKQGTLRGLHYQIQQSQGKLVRVVKGEIFDVAVDLRKSSPTFGEWVGTYLSSENKHQIWIPPGFAHGFYVVGEWAEIYYKASDYYTPQWERTLLWNDPILNIEWPLIDGKAPIISKKDAQGLPLSEAELYD